MGPARFTVTQHARNGAQFGLFPRGVIQSAKGVKLIVNVAKQECHSLLLFGHCAPLRVACTDCERPLHNIQVLVRHEAVTHCGHGEEASTTLRLTGCGSDLDNGDRLTASGL